MHPVLTSVCCLTWCFVSASDILKNTLNPKWPPMLIKAAAFFADGAAGATAAAASILPSANIDPAAAPASAMAAAAAAASPRSSMTNSTSSASLHHPILIRCFDWNSSGAMDFIGEARTDYVAVRRCKELRLDLLCPVDESSKSGGEMKKKGTLILEVCRAIQTRTESKDISATSASAKSISPKDAKKLKRQSTGLKM